MLRCSIENCSIKTYWIDSFHKLYTFLNINYSETIVVLIISSTVALTMAVSVLLEITTAWKVSKYGVFSDPYFPVFSPITGKYGLEKTPYLDTFHAVNILVRNEKIRTRVSDLIFFYFFSIWVFFHKHSRITRQ